MVIVFRRRYTRAMRCCLVFVLGLGLTACAATPPADPETTPVSAPAGEAPAGEAPADDATVTARDAPADADLALPDPDGDLTAYVPIDPGASPGSPIVTEEKDPLLDRTQQQVYEVVNNSSKWVDGFFGAGDVSEGDNVSRGRLSVGTQWDEREGFQRRLRLKARFPLTAMRNRLGLVVGRGDSDDFVDGTDDDNIDTLPERFNEFSDEDWLFGLGYAPDGRIDTGWDFGAGVRVTFPVEPYVRATYRWHKPLGERWLWRVRPRAFWQSQRGPGVTLANTLDFALTDKWLLRWWTILSAEREVDGMGWTTQFIAFQSLRDEDAFAYSVFASGENRNEVSLQNYGLEVRYRRRFLREWFFIELSTRLTWPREFLIEERETTFGVGIEFEMQFGDWPGRKQGGVDD